MKKKRIIITLLIIILVAVVTVVTLFSLGVFGSAKLRVLQKIKV